VLKRLSGHTVRRLAPRSVAALEEVVRLRGDVDELRVALERSQRELADLRETVAELGQGLQESRGQSLRIGQLTELVFAHLAEGADENRRDRSGRAG
jgi:hypothetical protein